MNRLVLVGGSGISALIGAPVVLVLGAAYADPAVAMQGPQDQVSYTCRFDNGPLAGQIQNYTGVSGPSIPAGVPCADGQGSTGIVISGAPAQQPLPPSLPAPLPKAVVPPTSFTCRFDTGPRAGQAQSYVGVTGMQPIPIGAQCADGQGSSGVAIADPAAPPVPLQPPAPPPGMSFTCQFTTGPRAGEIQSYAGVTGIQPSPVGAQCTDGQGSSGVMASAGAAGPVTIGDGTVPLPAARGAAPDVPPPPAVTVDGAAPELPPAPAPPARPSIPPTAAVGGRVGGLSGARWADLNNDGLVDGYVYKGQYYPGGPPQNARGAVPPPAFTPPPTARIGERG